MNMILLLGVLLGVGCAQAAELTLPVWVSDHMMLPANRSVVLNGTAESGVAVTVEFAGQKKTAVADSSNHWKVILDPMPASSIPNELIVSVNHQSEIVNWKFDDVLIGDIWLCSGQSNMGFPVGKSEEVDTAVAEIRNVDIRYFNGRSWRVVSAENVKEVSAVGAYFAMEMARRQKAPVGIFVAARGGTAIEAWVPVAAFPDTEDGNRFKPLVNDPEVLKAAEEDAADFRPWGQHRLYKWKLGRAVPSSLYEKLIRPFGNLPICGVLWYQGESNSGSQEYDLWLSNLIASYRSLWEFPRLPFVIIQLPAYDKGTEEGRAGWAGIQNMQASVARQTAFTEIVDIKDLGDLKDIHPRRKKEVGIRAVDAAWKLMAR